MRGVPRRARRGRAAGRHEPDHALTLLLSSALRFLETVARMPYFSYISMLHLYESLGWWRAGAELRKVRVCECACVRAPVLARRRARHPRGSSQA